MKDVKIFAENIEDEAAKQIEQLASTPAFEGAKIRIMPDAHAGAGCVIGFTANLGDKVVPNLVGVDIGCGMLTAKLGYCIADFSEFDESVKRAVPTGFNVRKFRASNTKGLGLCCFDKLRNVDRLDRSLGTLGGGNHFIEIDENSEGDQFLVIHSGSRNLGLQVANIYQQTAIENCRDDVPDDLKYLEGELAEMYLHDMRICQEFAKRNRELMAERIEYSARLQIDDAFHTMHNYIGDDGIVRKGAISAKDGERVLIPFNMRDGAIIGYGKGNDDWNCSAPHGAGRTMSRSKARKTIDVDKFRDQMQGIYSSTVGKGTLDEAPDAYKDAACIMESIEPTVSYDEATGRLMPKYNLKAEDARGRK